MGDGPTTRREGGQSLQYGRHLAAINEGQDSCLTWQSTATRGPLLGIAQSSGTPTPESELDRELFPLAQ